MPISIATSLVLISIFIVFKKLPNDIGKYDTLMKQFVTNEKKALAILSQNGDGKSKRRIAYELKYEGVQIWDEEIKLINEAEKLDIPNKFHQRNKTLKQYCLLRIKSYNLIYKFIDENTYKYQPQIDSCNRQIVAVLDNLKKENTE